jgi:hypothetical protein
METTVLSLANYLPVAKSCLGDGPYVSSSPLNSVESTASNGSSRSRKRMADWNVPAKSALLDLVEVHKSLERYESECETIRAYKGPAKGADERQLHMRAQRADEIEDDDESDFCAELTTPSRTSSQSLMSGAYSIQPSGPLPEADFDSNDLGFFRDVGVDFLTLSGGAPILSGKVARIEESAYEGGLPWDC